AANHLRRVRRGRRETVTFEILEENLRTGLREDPTDPEMEAMAGELRLRCTEAMLLCLDRDLRIAYVLGDLFQLAGDQAAEVLETEPAAYRKRLSRARRRLHDFVRDWCGVFARENPCRCAGQVECAVERGLADPKDQYLALQRARPAPAVVARAAGEVT